MKMIQSPSRPVAIWLVAGVLMIVFQIILGGITRLTDSGLSITEWKPLLGTLPPMNHQEWEKAFNQYKQIAQYKQLHSYFSLEDFKSIFFWEWLHRLWGRLIGIVFIIPFIIFLAKKKISKQMITPLIILFLLGGLQAVIGWVMVKSGLNDEDLYVSHIRLAIHFIAAMVLLVYAFWLCLKYLVKPKDQLPAPASKKIILLITTLVFFQLVYGAFMAGLKAATAAPTWPTINGENFPSNFMSYAGKPYSFFSALVNNPVAVHFMHRNLAYLICLLIVWWTIRVVKQKDNLIFSRVKWLPVFFVIVQVILGIFTLLTSPKKIPGQWGMFEWTALLHQATAMLLLLSLTAVYFLSMPAKKIYLHNRY